MESIDLVPSDKEMFIYIKCIRASSFQTIENIDWVRKSAFDAYICRILNKTFSSLLFIPYKKRESGGIIMTTYRNKSIENGSDRSTIIIPFYCMIPGMYKFCAYEGFPRQIMEMLLKIFQISQYIKVLKWNI